MFPSPALSRFAPCGFWEQKWRKKKKGFFKRLKEGLFKTHQGLVGKIDQIVAGKKKIDDDLLSELEETLITSDIGVQTAQLLLDHVTQKVRRKELEDADLLKKTLQEQMFQILLPQEKPDPSRQRPPLCDHGRGRERDGKNHHDRKDGPEVRRPGEIRPDGGGGHLPRRRDRAAGNLGAKGGLRSDPAEKRLGPFRRGL